MKKLILILGCSILVCFALSFGALTYYKRSAEKAAVEKADMIEMMSYLHEAQKGIEKWWLESGKSLNQEPSNSFLRDWIVPSQSITLFDQDTNLLKVDLSPFMKGGWEKVEFASEKAFTSKSGHWRGYSIFCHNYCQARAEVDPSMDNGSLPRIALLYQKNGEYHFECNVVDSKVSYCERLQKMYPYIKIVTHKPQPW